MLYDKDDYFFIFAKISQKKIKNISKTPKSNKKEINDDSFINSIGEDYNDHFY